MMTKTIFEQKFWLWKTELWKVYKISLPTTRFPELKILFPTLFANLVSRSNTTDQEAESVNKVFEGEPGKNYY